MSEIVAALAEKRQALETLQQEVAAQEAPVESQAEELRAIAQRAESVDVKAIESSRAAGRKIEPKYRNPENPSETWAGRGLTPKWLSAYESAGRTREEFRVRASSPSPPPLPDNPIKVQQALPFTPSVQCPDALTGALKAHGSTIRFDRNQEIQAEGEPALYFYQVVRGAVRTYKLLNDGRRQINAFQLPGDVIELGTAANYCFSAEAISPTVLRFAKRSTIVELTGRNSGLAVEIWQRTARNLQCAQEHMTLLGRKNADERLASFILEMSGRSGSESILELPMSRQDIADYLGLTIETISRMLTHLESRAAIRRESGRRLEVHNRAALNVLNA
jgi:CRP-like cAMP-binding protein/DNA-binding protein H-NS